MSFGESVFLAGFNQKTIKEDLFIHNKTDVGTLEHSGRQPTKADLKGLTHGAHRMASLQVAPASPTCHPLMLCHGGEPSRVF